MSIFAGSLSGRNEEVVLVRIHGVYEYDDDDLTPGKKKEGGLHQNLFDAEGILRSSARFIPDTDQPYESYGFGYTDPCYAARMVVETEAEERQRERERKEAAEFLANVVALLAAKAYVKAKPHAQRLWREKIGPVVQARRDTRSRRKSERQTRREQKRSTDQIDLIESATDIATEPKKDIVAASRMQQRNMNTSEARIRYLMALEAKKFSENQLRMISNATILENEQFIELEQSLSELHPSQISQLILLLERKPSMSTDEVAALAMSLSATRQEDTPTRDQ